jgi:probable rRNA maturation factor
LRKIQFISKSIEYQINDVGIFIKWLEFVAKNENCNIKEVKYYFVSEKEIININNNYLKHNYVTDIITFGTNFLNIIDGEIFICIDIIKENSVIYSNGNFQRELSRVIVHGLLHLIGYNDISEDEVILMRTKEDFYLNNLEN